MTNNEHFFEKAIELAEKARGKTGMNPIVGAVVVKENNIVGTGYTQECGKNHAEIEALLAAGEAAKGAELYVTLEPCCHQGKTGPCTEAIIEAGIKKVYAGIIDPNPSVNGCGFEALKQAGIEVVTGLAEERVRKQLEVYLTNRSENRPFFAMKSAVSLDGKLACSTGASKWISSTESRELGYRLRKDYKVILTGIRTVLRDDPLLDVRLDSGNEPSCQAELRIVLDSKLRIPRDSKLVLTASKIPVLLIKSKDYRNPEKEKELYAAGVEIASAECNDKGELSLQDIIKILNQREIPSVLIEAGGQINTCFLTHRLIDKIYYFIAPKILGGNIGVFNDLRIHKPSDAIRFKREEMIIIGDDILLVGYPRYK